MASAAYEFDFELPTASLLKPETVAQLKDLETDAILALGNLAYDSQQNVPKANWPDEIAGTLYLNDAVMVIERPSEKLLISRTYRATANWHTDLHNFNKGKDTYISILTSKHPTVYAAGKLIVDQEYAHLLARQCSYRPHSITGVRNMRGVLSVLNGTFGESWVESIAAGTLPVPSHYLRFEDVVIVQALPFHIHTGQDEKTLHKSSKVPTEFELTPRLFARSYYTTG